MTTDNFCLYLQNRLIQTSQTGGQWYSDTSPFRKNYKLTLQENKLERCSLLPEMAELERRNVS
jgi:hypothetical protein